MVYIDVLCLMFLTKGPFVLLDSIVNLHVLYILYICTIRSTQCYSSNQTARFAFDFWEWSLFVRKWSWKPHGGPDWSLVAAPQKGSFIFSSWTTGRRKGGQFFLARYVGMMTRAQWSVNWVWRGWYSSIRRTLLGWKVSLREKIDSGAVTEVPPRDSGQNVPLMISHKNESEGEGR